MRYVTLLVTCLCAIVCAMSANAGPITDSIAYQGRLTDASNSPVPDGPKDLILSLWTDSVGGTMLHSEVVVVSTSQGLFTACLGCGSSTFPDIFTGQILFLQTQLSGQPAMTPRTRLRSVPYSMSASSLNTEVTQGSARARGIITNKPGTINPKGKILLDQDVDGNGTVDVSAETDVDSDSASFRLNGLPPGEPVIGTLSLSASGTGARSVLQGRTGSTTGTIRMAASPDSTVSVLDYDSDGDGVPESSDRRTVSANDVHHNVISRSGSTTATIRTAISPDSMQSYFGQDADGDGTPEAAMISTEYTPAGLASGIVRQDMVVDPDDDGTPNTSIESIVTPDKSTFRAINTKGTGATVRVGMEASDSGSVASSSDADGDGNAEARGIITVKPGGANPKGSILTSYDSDDDGAPDNTAEMIVTPTTSSVAINQKGTGADKGRISSTTTPDSVVTEQTFEFTNSLLMPTLMKAKEKANRTKCSNNLRYQSPVATNEAELDVDSAGSGLTLSANNGGTGIEVRSKSRNGTVKITATQNSQSLRNIVSADSTAASTLLEADSDGDGNAEFSLAGVVDDTSSQLGVQRPSDGGGIHRDGWNVLQVANNTSEKMKSYFANGDVVTQEQVVQSSGSHFRAINTKGTGSILRVGMAASDSGSVESSSDSDGDGNAEAKGIIVVKTGGSTSSSCRISTDPSDDGAADYSAELLSTSDSAGLRLNGLPPGVPVINSISMTASATGVQVTVGGATCDGTNWINASDKNVKENFRAVNGEELLEKISALKITQWNYKSDDRIDHIGPTAQDFKEIFGVGSDGKSISTIDPSGIALAAIKELSKKNDRLEQENQTLRKEMGELKKLVQKLASDK